MRVFSARHLFLYSPAIKGYTCCTLQFKQPETQTVMQLIQSLNIVFKIHEAFPDSRVVFFCHTTLFRIHNFILKKENGILYVEKGIAFAANPSIDFVCRLKLRIV